MPEIKYKELKNYLKGLEKDVEKKQFVPVYLIYGEELLYKAAFDELLDAILPASAGSLNYEAFDGTNENIFKVIQHLNTYALLPGTKVIAVRDSKLFYSKQDLTTLLKKTKEVYHKNDIAKAAKHFISIMALANLSFDDVAKENRSKTLKIDDDILNDDNWLDSIIDYCIAHGLSPKEFKDNSNVLQKSIENGFPKGNHLIITTDTIDKRKKLFKTIEKNGMVINCFVPKGERYAEKKAQEEVLLESMRAILTKRGKIIDKAAYLAMYEMTGFDLRTFSNNLEKLVNYVGKREKITVKDVESVLKRTKKDPIYNFTNAITDKNAEDAIYYVDSLVSGNIIKHPLQLLAATTNQIRKLLLIKDFVESPRGGVWHAGIQYNNFIRDVMPAIQAHDNLLLNQIKGWEDMLIKNRNIDNPGSNKKKAKKSAGSEADLLIAKNPKNPYPVYQMFKKSEKFTKDELVATIKRLSEADLRFKTTALDPKMILEDLILHICGAQNIKTL